MPGTVPEAVARVEEKVDGLTFKLDRLCLSIEGDGGIDHPGLKVTVDRLVQTENRRIWILRTMGAGFLGLLAERVWGFIAK